MFKILLKKQMAEIFRGYFYDSKKNKKRSTTSTIMFIFLYAFIMIGILGGMFTQLALSLCKPFVAAGMSWLYFLIISMIAVALGAFGSVFNTFTGLYMSKDNDLLLSLPIPVKSILAARLAGVYLIGLMYSAVVTVPAAIVYWIKVPVTVAGIVGPIFFVILISGIVLILSCLLGWCVAKISTKLKNRSFITIIVSLLFIAAYYFVYYKAQGVINALIMNAAVYGRKVKDSMYMVYMFGRACEGDITGVVLYTVIIGALCAATFYVLSRSFASIATSTGNVSKRKYTEKKTDRKSISGALLSKEFGRFTSSANYVLNSGMGSLFLIIFGGFIVIRGNEIMKFANQFFVSGKDAGILIIIATAAICVVAAMNDMVVPSVSLEGKSIWIAQSLPIHPWKILRAKIMVQILMTAIPAIICDICIIVVLECSVADIVLIIITTLAFVVMMAFAGMFLGIKMPNLTWTNELAPIKQSLGVMIAMFGGAAVAVGMGALFWWKAWKMGAELYMLLSICVYICISAVIYVWLKKSGSNIFAEL